jgi:hypothetical protein
VHCLPGALLPVWQAKAGRQPYSPRLPIKAASLLAAPRAPPSPHPPYLNRMPRPATLLQGDCSPTDLYADYPGTLRGLTEGACDVAFTKETVPLEYSKDGTEPQTWSTLNKVGLRSWRQQCCKTNSCWDWCWNPAVATHTTLAPHPCLPPLLQADFMLLCPGGGCKAVEEFDSCSIAKSPSRAGGALAPATCNAFCISAHWVAAFLSWHSFVS